MKYSPCITQKRRQAGKTLAILYLVLFSAMVYAELSDLKVYTPIVKKKGDFGFEMPGNTTVDKNEEFGGFQYHEFEFEYGVTDWWASSITNSLIMPADGGLKYNVLDRGNTFQFTEEGKYWLDFGIHIELEFDDESDESDQIETRFMFRKEIANVEHILNLNFEQQFGHQADESLELEYIWRAKLLILEAVAVGFEVFGALGEVKNLDKK